MADAAEPRSRGMAGPHPERTSDHPHRRGRQQLGLLLIAAAVVLATVAAAGMVVLRSTETPLVEVGQPAPDFALRSTAGGYLRLAETRGRPVVLVFVPSVLCDWCQEQLRAIQAALPELRARDAIVLVVSTDTSAVQESVADDLELDYPLLSELPSVDQHPAGSAYGVYHLPGRNRAPVDANAAFAIDATGIVRAARVQPSRPLTAADIRAVAEAAPRPTGGGQ